MKPIIGILAEVDDDQDSKMKHSYAKAVEEAGGLPILLPYVEEPDTVSDYVQLCDGFLFSGGADIHPSHYEEDLLPCCGNIFKYRDDLEFRVFTQAFISKKPILGICRGAQIINVALGGTLYQDIPSQYKTEILHRQSEPVYAFSHEVKVIPETPLHHLVKKERIRANSFHHQSVKDLGKGLTVMALADDGIVEAMYFQGEQYLRAYQWHPERLVEADSDNYKLLKDFIDAC